jgi:ATP-dependent Clp protease ATP-binding subunit ClpC
VTETTGPRRKAGFLGQEELESRFRLSAELLDLLIRAAQGGEAIELKHLVRALVRNRATRPVLAACGIDEAGVPRAMFEQPRKPGPRWMSDALSAAHSLGHRSIGSEHLLLGLLADPTGIVPRALGSMDLTADRARAEVARRRPADSATGSGQMPFEPAARKALELALRKALAAGRNDVGPDLVMLAVIDDDEGEPARIVAAVGATPERVRAAVKDAAEREPRPPPPPAPPRRLTPGPEVDRLLAKAAARAREHGNRPTEIADLLYALPRDPNTTAWLRERGVDVEVMLATLDRHLAG